MEKFIVDASFILSFLLPDERSEEVREIFSKFKHDEIKLISSHLLEFEVGNGLKSAYLSKRISREKFKKYLKVFGKLDIEFVEIDINKTMEASLKKDISFYDAVYVSLAQTKKAKLLTFDKRLATI